MLKNPPSGIGKKARQNGAPGTLTWAWLGLFALIVSGVLMIQFFGTAEPGRTVVTVAIDGDPERFAPTSGKDNRQAPGTVIEDANIAPQDSDPRQVEVINKVPVATEEDAVALEGDSAEVIRLNDLPSSASEAALTGNAVAKIEIIGTPPPLPDRALAMNTANGSYPKIGSDGRKPATYYRRGFSDPAERPRIAVIIAGLGLSTNLTAQAINDLPPEVTLAFAPYSKDLPQWTAQARAAGHELMIELPMEAAGLEPEALGPAALLSARSEAENRQRLNWLLSRFQGYFAVTNYLGSKFSKDTPAVSPVYTQVRDAGVAFIADTEIAPDNLRASGILATTVDLLISDTSASPDARLKQLEARARKEQRVLVKIYPTEQSLTEISLWAKSLRGKGIALAPASSMLQ